MRHARSHPCRGSRLPGLRAHRLVDATSKRVAGCCPHPDSPGTLSPVRSTSASPFGSRSRLCRGVKCRLPGKIRHVKLLPEGPLMARVGAGGPGASMRSAGSNPPDCFAELPSAGSLEDLDHPRGIRCRVDEGEWRGSNRLTTQCRRHAEHRSLDGGGSDQALV
jgi:hypothetical protein